MRRPSLTTRRIIAGLALAVAAVCAGNYYLELNLFGPWAKKVMVLSFVLLGLSQILFGASPAELRQYRQQKRQSE